MSTNTIKYFKFAHLPEGQMRDVSEGMAGIAEAAEESIPDNPEKEAGMRKLLEAKDCFVRACLPE